MRQLFEPPGRLMLVNRVLALMTPQERIKAMYRQYDPSDILITSSFGTSSALLLHMIHEACPEQIIHFIDTGYHFEETYQYKEVLTQRLGLQVVDLLPNTEIHEMTSRKAMWETNPSRCCYINKVKPLEAIKENKRVWVSGLMWHQNKFRSNLSYLDDREKPLRYYPIIDMIPEQVHAYMKNKHLPEHPLKNAGYESIGCTHCTVAGTGRDGRWQGADKTECGLHLRTSNN